MRGIGKVVIGGLIALAIIIAAAVAINVFLSSGVKTTTTATHLRTYRSDQYRFAVSYDADEIALTAGPSGLGSPPFIAVLKFRHSFGGVWIICYPTQRQVDSADLRNLLVRSVRHYDPGYVRIGRIDPAVLGSLPGFETGGRSGTDFEYLTFAVGRGRAVYIISAQAHPADWHALQSTFLSTMRSFKYTG